MTTPLSIRVSDELKSEFMQTREQTGLKQEDFMSAMLTRFKESQAELDTASPIHKELVKVKKAFAQGERVVSAFMEIAANDKIQAETAAQEKVEAAGKEVATLKEKIQRLKELNRNYKKDISDQRETISGLQDKAESIKTLKEAWSEKD